MNNLKMQVGGFLFVKPYYGIIIKIKRKTFSIIWYNITANSVGRGEHGYNEPHLWRKRYTEVEYFPKEAKQLLLFKYPEIMKVLLGRRVNELSR